MIPRPPTHPMRMSDPPRASVFCMEINDFSHEDCPVGTCGCACHLPEVAS